MPIGTVAIGQVINDIRVRLKEFSDENFGKKLILNEINETIAENSSLGGVDTEDYSGNFTIPSNYDTIDMSLIFSDYKKIKTVTSVWWNNTRSTSGDLAINLPEKEFITQRSYGAGSIYANTVIWYRKNNYLYFCKGSQVAAYGERQVNFIRIPDKATVLSDLLDIKDDKIGILKDKVIRKLLLEKGIMIDQQTAEQKLITMKSTEESEKLKHKENG